MYHLKHTGAFGRGTKARLLLQAAAQKKEWRNIIMQDPRNRFKQANIHNIFSWIRT